MIFNSSRATLTRLDVRDNTLLSSIYIFITCLLLNDFFLSLKPSNFCSSIVYYCFLFKNHYFLFFSDLWHLASVFDSIIFRMFPTPMVFRTPNVAGPSSIFPAVPSGDQFLNFFYQQSLINYMTTLQVGNRILFEMNQRLAKKIFSHTRGFNWWSPDFQLIV